MKVSELKEKMKDETFKRRQKRRSSTEAKIAHIKEIAQNPMKQKGIGNRKVHLGLSTFAHNLFKAARIHRKQQEDKIKQSAAA